jgi:hypothetical protein
MKNLKLGDFEIHPDKIFGGPHCDLCILEIKIAAYDGISFVRGTVSTINRLLKLKKNVKCLSFTVTRSKNKTLYTTNILQIYFILFAIHFNY